MCVSLERLFCLDSQQAISTEPRANGKGIFSREDAKGVIAMVQHVFPVGIKLLETRIGGNEHSRRIITGAITARLARENVRASAARALAVMAVNEVCGTKKCPQCNGVGYRDPRYACRSCKGSGLMDVRTLAALTQLFNELCDDIKPITEVQFQQIYYDLYMSAVDTLYQHDGDAAKYAAKLMRMIEQENWGEVWI